MQNASTDETCCEKEFSNASQVYVSNEFVIFSPSRSKNFHLYQVVSTRFVKNTGDGKRLENFGSASLRSSHPRITLSAHIRPGAASNPCFDLHVKLPACTHCTAQ